MKRVSYQPWEMKWYSEEEGCYFGELPIAVGTGHSAFSFFVRQHNERLGPLIGILTSGTEEGRLCGDFKRFATIQEALQQQGGVSFVFSPYGLQDSYIEGYIWLAQKHWHKCLFPYPNAVYNRIPYRKHEQTAIAQEAIQRLRTKQIPFFNSSFFSKWELHQAFSSNEQLQPYLLQTMPLQELDDLQSMLERHNTIYVKQSEAAKGKHVYSLQLLDENKVQKQDIDGSCTKTILETWQDIAKTEKLHIAQQALFSDLHNGRKYDLRVAVHYISGDFHVSGIGVRLAKQGQVVTHVPHGGEILSVEQLQRPVQEDTISLLARECGKSLCQHFGAVREFSLDIGVDSKGHYYIFEANSKPMIFDEPAIYEQMLQSLLTIFSEEAGFC